MSTDSLSSRDDELAAFLAMSPPRRVPPRLEKAARAQAASRFQVGMGLVFGTLGLVFAVLLFPWEFWSDWRLRESDSATTQGQIISAQETSLSINKTHVWRYVFEYEPPGSGKLRREGFTTGRRWSEGDSVVVRYRPEAVATACIEGGRSSQGSAITAVALVFPVIGFALAAAGWRARRRARELLERGQLTEATIVSLELGKVSRNYQPVYKLKLSRLDGAGTIAASICGHTPEIVRFVEGRTESKLPVFVLYDPHKPQHIVLPEAL